MYDEICPTIHHEILVKNIFIQRYVRGKCIFNLYI